MEKISCPNCRHQFDIEGVIAQDIKLQMNKELEQMKAQWLEQQKNREAQLDEQVKEFELKRSRQNEIFKTKLEQAIKDQEEKIKNKALEDVSVQIDQQNKELVESKEKIKNLQSKEMKLLRMQRKMDEMLRDKEIELEKKIIEERHAIEQKVSQRIHAEVELRDKEKDKKLADQYKLIEELKRKSEQGSMQLQGEVQELALEEYLRQQFPYDLIDEIKKGSSGGDTVHTVIDDMQNKCGKILYESKRTKTFSNDWIDKLKIDQRRVQADLAVIITQSMPRDMNRFGLMKDIWICSFEEFKGLCHVFRHILIRTTQAKASQVNKGDKMELLYNFLTSEEFKLQITGIVDGFRNMKNDIDREKRSMQNIWKRREKQLEIVIGNTIDMHASIKGIAGAAIPSIDSLELPDDDGLDHLT